MTRLACCLFAGLIGLNSQIISTSVAYGVLESGVFAHNSETSRYDIEALPNLANFSVDDALLLESIRRGRFSPGGDVFVFERVGPASAADDFGRYTQSRGVGTLYATNLRSDLSPQLLTGELGGGSYTLLGFLPNGEGILYQLLPSDPLDQGTRLGVLWINSNQNEVFEFNSYPTVLPPAWLDGGILSPALGADHFSVANSLRAEYRERLIEAWREQRSGQSVTASVVGSGAFAELKSLGEYLAFIDYQTGEVTEAHIGEFLTMVPSPVKNAVAAFRSRPVEFDVTNSFEQVFNVGNRARDLHVFQISDDGEIDTVEPCLDCDVYDGQSGRAVAWSPDGCYLAFYAREPGDDWANASFFVWDRLSERTTRIDLGAYSVAGTRGLTFFSLGLQWVGTSLFVRLQPEAESLLSRDDQSRPDWFLVSSDGLRNLTDEFVGEVPTLLGATSESLILLHQGEAWAIGLDGSKRHLTDHIFEPVKRVRRVGGGRTIESSEGIFPLLIGENINDADSIVFLDVESGEAETIDLGSGSARLLDISLESRRIAFMEQVGNADRLVIADRSGARELLRINTHLNEIDFPNVRTIDHEGPEGDNRRSVLLMPPGWQPGDPALPTIVHIYPGQRPNPSFFTLTGRGQQFFMAANGYAVLFPDLPDSSDAHPSWPLRQGVDEVFAAVGAAIEHGFVDPERMAVSGTSMGGWATVGLVAFTDRFRAAVANAGPYNLISAYGDIDVRRRPAGEYLIHNLFMAGVLESGQVNFGSAPWENPELYWENSPLAHVDNINTPILLTHGDYDFVNITQAEELYTALVRLGKDARFIRYWGEDHIIQSPHNIRHKWQQTLDWYDMHLRDVDTVPPDTTQ